MTTPQHVKRACGVVAVLAGLGALTLVVTGGYEFRIAGILIRGHGPDRLAMLAVMAGALYFLLGGRTWLPRDEDLARLPGPGVFAAALAVATFATAWWFGSPAVGGSDSYGYISQAHLWLSGDLHQSQRWAFEAPWPLAPESFVPLGYRWIASEAVIVPVYSTGLPLLMALAIGLAGSCAAFVIVPALAAVTVFATYRLGRAVASPWVGLAAAWLVATNAVFVYMMVQPMSDVPAAAAWTVAFLFAAVPRVAGALGSGLAVSLALLVRINLAPLAIVPVAWFAWSDWRGRKTESVFPRRVFLFLLGLAPGVIAAGAINMILYGSPLETGYGTAAGMFDVDRFRTNARLYAGWFAEVATPFAWLGVAAVLMPVRRLWPHEHGRRLTIALASFMVLLYAEYCFYAVFDVWWYLRFLLPALPIVMIGLGQLAARAVASRSPGIRVAVAVMLLALGVHGVLLARDRFAFVIQLSDGKYARAGRAVVEATDPSSVVFSMQHSGSLRYYSGRLTVRFDQIDPAWLERAVAWFSSQGIHPYALLEQWEVEEWRSRFGTGTALAQLDVQPIRAFEAADRMALYDLLATGPPSPPVISPLASDCRCAPPALPSQPAFSASVR